MSGFSNIWKKNEASIESKENVRVFDQMKAKQQEMIKTTELRLERMRETVDEKLHKTLEERLLNLKSSNVTPKKGVLAKYKRLVGSASKGAITDWNVF